MVCLPALALEFGGDAWPSISREAQGDPLNHVAQLGIAHSRRGFQIEAIVRGAAHACQCRQLNRRQRATPFPFLPDFPAEGGLAVSACDLRRSSICRKQPFKKSISMACWPILRSNSATCVSSARRRPSPENAEFGRS